MLADFPVTVPWQLPTGDHPGRRSAAEVTVFDSVGFALEDFPALHHVDGLALALALAPGTGERVALVPHTPDPKNLFGLLGAVAAPALRRARPAATVQAAGWAARLRSSPSTHSPSRRGLPALGTKAS